VRGCGGFDQLFHAFMPDVVLRAAALYRQVIILPSSFDPRQALVKQCLEQPNVFAITREMQSFDSLEPFGRRLAAMDCAIYHRRFTPQSAANTAGGDKLLVLRRDKGSPLIPRSLQPNPTLNEDVSIVAHSVEDWLNRIDGAGTVITDRLHVAVAAILLGRKLIMIDPYDSKLSSYVAFAFEDSFDERIERRTVEWLAAEGLAVPA